MIDQLRRYGLIRVTVEQEGDLWVARLSVNDAGQGDVVSRQSAPDAALRGACTLFGDLGSRRPEKAATAPPARPRKGKPATNGEDLI